MSCSANDHFRRALPLNFIPDRQLIALQLSNKLSEIQMHEDTNMASITISNLEDEVMSRLRAQAERNGRSTEAEARAILRKAVDVEPEPKNLAQFIHDCYAPLGGIELDLPPRKNAESF